MTRVFVLAPHPDDEVLGVGGTIARHTRDGDEVCGGILTRGNPAIFSNDFIQQGRAEAGDAHRLLGVKKTLFCDEIPAPGTDTVPLHKIAGIISKWLVSWQAETLYVPHWGDIHTDHRLAYQAALVAARPGYNSVNRILSYETLSETEWSSYSPEQAFLPTVYVDISDFLDLKKEAMSCFRSQLKDFPHPRSLDGIDALARIRGSTVMVGAAEAFVLVREYF